MRSVSEQPAATRTALIVEDDLAIRELLRDHLMHGGFSVEEASDGRAGLECALRQKFDIVILDVMLPSLNGITLCRTLRRQSNNRATPILMLTARASESDKVLGLESGADDYLTKPFGVREFVARVSAVLRRSEAAVHAEASDRPRIVTTRNLSLDPQRRETKVRGEEIELTNQEFDVLYLLAARPGIVSSRAALLNHVWSSDVSVTERTIDTVVSRLRKKIEKNPQDPELILTAWGVGYKCADVE
jgi:DNA-binding response OmpR family regulator